MTDVDFETHVGTHVDAPSHKRPDGRTLSEFDLSAAAARACVERGYSVGLDTFSPDPTPSADPDRHGSDEPTDQPAHDVLLGADRRIVENLTTLGAVPTRLRLLAYPLKFSGADGSPIRAVARFEE